MACSLYSAGTNLEVVYLKETNEAHIPSEVTLHSDIPYFRARVHESVLDPILAKAWTMADHLCSGVIFIHDESISVRHRLGSLGYISEIVCSVYSGTPSCIPR